MSIFSDYAVGALTDEEYRDECIRMNREDTYEQERYYETEDYDYDED